MQKKGLGRSGLVWLFLIVVGGGWLYGGCHLAPHLKPFATRLSSSEVAQYSHDTKKSASALKGLCLWEIAFDEEGYAWKMLLVSNPKQPKGAFWFLPHDDENEAFQTAIYATQRYGGGFLAVVADDRRYFHGQDPNRNFGTTKKVAQTCAKQHHQAPLYTKIVFDTMAYYKGASMPYLSLHNNKEGWYGNGGSGGVSMLHSSRSVKSYSPYTVTPHTKGLADEDNLVYIAGFSTTPPKEKLSRVLRLGLNVKYEVVNARRNDCSMSNYTLLGRGSSNYFNLEAQKGDLVTHKQMVDRIIGEIQRRR